MDVVLQTDGQPRHELCTWSDAVAVKVRSLWFDGWQLATTALKVPSDTHYLIVLLTGETKMDWLNHQIIEYWYMYSGKLSTEKI